MVDGKSIDFAALRPALVELAGQTALRDAVVDRRLAARLRGAGITVTDERIERERALLLETLSPDAERARELLLGIRARQGLGESRFRALLARNAGLRALVEREVRLDDEGIANAFDVLHGPKRTARIAVVASLADAERLIADRAARPFADLAVERSLDESAARGGLLAPMARRDPSYPEPLRAAIYATAVGATSAPILDGARYYVVEVLGESPADGTTPEAARAACERLLRLARERLLMDALARDLGALEGVTVFDRAFDPPAGG
jgi:parvulin-like peptidyl-prolyl isomerase